MNDIAGFEPVSEYFCLMEKGNAHSPLQMALKYLKHLLLAGNAHSIHSPFVYSLYTKAIKSGHFGAPPGEIARLRKQMAKDKTLHTCEFSGNKDGRDRRRSFSEIVSHSAVPHHLGSLLFRLASFIHPSTIVEVGTSTGISTLYLAKAAPQAQVVSFEGCPGCARKAGENFSSSGVHAVDLRVGPFDQTLPDALKSLTRVDLVFIDGNHSGAALDQYFTLLTPLAGNDTLFIFDDIHWSPSMEMGWEKVCRDPQVHVSIDLFFFGLVFLRPQQVKEHFDLRYVRGVWVLR